jgi:hypothetical protein
VVRGAAALSPDSCLWHTATASGTLAANKLIKKDQPHCVLPLPKAHALEVTTRSASSGPASVGPS